MTFTYTDSALGLDSSLVEEAYYNGALHRLVVVLASGTAYEYSRVPAYVFNGLVQSPSPGKFYNTRIKSVYGPGTCLGYVDEDSDYFVSGYTAPSMEAVTAGAGMPKGLVYRMEHDKGNATSAFGNVTLTLNPPVSDKRRHDVVFTVHGHDKVRTHTVQAESVDAAVDALLETASMLDLTFEVKAVTTYFV